MQATIFTVTVLILSLIGYYMGRSRAVSSVDGNIRELHSLPRHYGYYVGMWCGLPALFICIAWLLFEPQIVNSVVLSGVSSITPETSSAMVARILSDIKFIAANGSGVSKATPELIVAAEHYLELKQIGSTALAIALVSIAIIGLLIGKKSVGAKLQARDQVERVIRYVLLASSIVAILTTIGIVSSLLFEAIRFFGKIPLTDFLFGVEWSPQIAMRKDQVASEGAFGAVPIFAGTMLISFIAMCVAVPVGLMSAVYMSEYASPKIRGIGKPVLEILAGIPTVVYGFFAALVVAPTIRNIGEGWGLEVASESALAAGLVMGIMIIPFVSSLSDDVIRAVPQSLRDGSYALGGTKSETVLQVVLPAALPGIVGGIMLAISRAIGETMIVVMAAGLSANLTANPLHAVTTATVQMVTLLVGDQEFDSPKTLAAFALGLVLFCVTLCLNVIALRVVAKYREKYD
ncbi:ABC-type phosphate transport system [Candidatus Terasakiella magnetica]|uniref:Phosphate transport system permease protein n=1 Tax=Candidatus Terasakiella magnetica TaxID=1867952 RepID=A0A1C3RCA0_9PROT|nr:phosphate ABC transporter permease subunit PstC [Candidatus Terasakiella magnetica]SCA54891.1 ABC-type phosphate transport system [Candidatus Terasakiella magnetica]